MVLIAIGVALILLGVVLSSMRQARRGRLSEDPGPSSGPQGDTLEPSGKGEDLSLKPALPGIALYLLGGILILAGAFL
jgi:hypothetical protein